MKRITITALITAVFALPVAAAGSGDHNLNRSLLEQESSVNQKALIEGLDQTFGYVKQARTGLYGINKR